MPAVGAARTGSGAAASSSRPAAARISASRLLVPGSTSASSVSRASSELSRAAVRARIVATPSMRLSCSARCDSPVSAACTRARSSRTSRATAWKVSRVDGRTRPRWTATSMSRTALASTGSTPSASREREARAGAPPDARGRVGRRSRVAMPLSSAVLVAVAAGRPALLLGDGRADAGRRSTRARPGSTSSRARRPRPGAAHRGGPARPRVDTRQRPGAVEAVGGRSCTGDCSARGRAPGPAYRCRRRGAAPGGAGRRVRRGRGPARCTGTPGCPRGRPAPRTPAPPRR